MCISVTWTFHNMPIERYYVIYGVIVIIQRIRCIITGAIILQKLFYILLHNNIANYIVDGKNST